LRGGGEWLGDQINEIAVRIETRTVPARGKAQRAAAFGAAPDGGFGFSDESVGGNSGKAPAGSGQEFPPR
jgi:hypothetical protein